MRCETVIQLFTSFVFLASSEASRLGRLRLDDMSYDGSTLPERTSEFGTPTTTSSSNHAALRTNPRSATATRHLLDAEADAYLDVIMSMPTATLSPSHDGECPSVYASCPDLPTTCVTPETMWGLSAELSIENAELLGLSIPRSTTTLTCRVYLGHEPCHVESGHVVGTITFSAQSIAWTLEGSFSLQDLFETLQCVSGAGQLEADLFPAPSAPIPEPFLLPPTTDVPLPSPPPPAVVLPSVPVAPSDGKPPTFSLSSSSLSPSNAPTSAPTKDPSSIISTATGTPTATTSLSPSVGTTILQEEDQQERTSANTDSNSSAAMSAMMGTTVAAAASLACMFLLL